MVYLYNINVYFVYMWQVTFLLINIHTVKKICLYYVYGICISRTEQVIKSLKCDYLYLIGYIQFQ